MRGRSSGNPGEAAILNALLERGFDVAVPFGDGHPYDLVLHVDGTTFLRIQCKTAWRNGGCLSFNAHATDHGRGALSYVGLADLFGVYSSVTGSAYLAPITAVGLHEGRLRLDPPRNNQRRRVRFAADYEIDQRSIERLRQVVPSPAASAAA